MKDEHTHCNCNGVTLCRLCHEWVHAHPFEARRLGYVIPRNEPEPSTVPIITYYGRVLFRCTGRIVLAPPEREEPDGEELQVDPGR